MKRIRKRLHPIGRAIENILAAGHTPRLQFDARRKDVTVPEHVRARWGARLIIDVDPSWPLAMEHTKEALELDLAFQGVVERCVLGWGSIYAIVDRSSNHQTPTAAARATRTPAWMSSGPGSSGKRALSATATFIRQPVQSSRRIVRFVS